MDAFRSHPFYDSASHIMKIIEISKHLEACEDKSHVATIKKVLRAYEQTFSGDVDVMYILSDIEMFFTRLQDRYENAFTIRNILAGQQKLLDLPMVKEQLEDKVHKLLHESTRAKMSLFTKTTNDKQRAKIKKDKQLDDKATGVESDVELACEQVCYVEPSQPSVRKDPVVDGQSSILQARTKKIEGLVSALKIILDLVD